MKRNIHKKMAKKSATSTTVNLMPFLVEALDDPPELIQLLACGSTSSPTNIGVVLVAALHQPSVSLFNHRLVGFVNIDVPMYNDLTFKAHFRMSRSTFQSLLEAVAPHLTCRSNSLETKVLSTAWLLSNDESFHGVADRFNLSKGTLHNIFLLVCKEMKHLKSVMWPTEVQMKISSSIFLERTGFPGVIGCIDGCHIPIKGRAQDRSSFINRKGFSSVVLQCICNHNMSFIDAYAGWPGSVHDSRVFRNSPITAELEKLPPNLHILGDSAYPLSNSLITPFREVGNLKEEETRYNIIHSSTRSVIERAFALLKGKFRRLKSLDMSLDHSIPDVIMACVYLHNFILDKEGGNADIPLFRDIELNFSTATQKREAIAAWL